jgi:hypothetical protein
MPPKPRPAEACLLRLWRGAPCAPHRAAGYVRVGNRGLGFMSREIGIRGLGITMVWHPGWPIAHRLWPRAGPRCSGRIRRRSTSRGIRRGAPGRILLRYLHRQTTVGDYQLWTAEHALTEGVQPVISSEIRSHVSEPGGYSSPGLLIASGWGSPVRAARAVATSGRPART